MTDRPLVALVVLSYNGLEDTRKCLRSLVPAMRPYATTFLVDNGSTDGTDAAVAQEFPWARGGRREQKEGPVGGNNAGIRAALELGAEWILLLNNDTIVDPALLDRLMDAARAHPEYAILGPVIKFMDDPDVVMTDATIFNRPDPRGFFVRVPVPVTRSAPPAVIECDLVNGCALMIRADMVRRIGPFDERFFMYHDEADLCLRSLEAGGRNGVIDHALVWHKGSATSQGAGKPSVRYFDARNLLFLLRKHHWSTQRGRGRLAGAKAYGLYMYDWYCHLREQGNDAAATAVLEGMCDGLAGVTGLKVSRRRRLLPVLRRGFDVLRHRPGRTKSSGEAARTRAS
jgi:GT2 family glycosyltransferase